MLRIMAPKQSAAPTSSENGGSAPATANDSQPPSNKKAPGAGANNRSRGRGRGGERKEGKPAKQGDQDNAAGPSDGKNRPRREPRSAKNDGEGRVCVCGCLASLGVVNTLMMIVLWVHRAEEEGVCSEGFERAKERRLMHDQHTKAGSQGPCRLSTAFKRRSITPLVDCDHEILTLSGQNGEMKRTCLLL